MPKCYLFTSLWKKWLYVAIVEVEYFIRYKSKTIVAPRVHHLISNYQNYLPSNIRTTSQWKHIPGFWICVYQLSLRDILLFPTYCRYKEKVSHYSAILRDLPPAKERAIFWIEHVLKFGGEHLRAHVFELNFIQYYLIDVAVFLIVLVVVFYHMFRCMCRLCDNVGKRIFKRNNSISRNSKQDWSRSIRLLLWGCRTKK